ncbi:MAG: isoaspartyl peptidase/L-asparaginase family protein [Nitrospiraceae bacterium]
MPRVSRRPLLLIHGGAGVRAITAAQRRVLRDALAEGWACLAAGAPSIDAVERAIRVMEGSKQFNAGVGARRQLDGIARMDASIMRGDTLAAGAVASMEGMKHPISVARRVMQDTTHVMLVGAHATRFARHLGLERMPRDTGAKHSTQPAEFTTARGLEASSLFQAMTAKALRLREKHGRETVGAVAVDRKGHVAAGASTGGIDIMLPGRVGDTPLIGAGVYADDECGAVSMTGWGESIIRLVVAKSIVERLGMGQSPMVATRAVFAALVRRVQGTAGAIVLTPDGRFALRHTTPRMAGGYWDGRGAPVVGDRYGR